MTSRALSRWLDLPRNWKQMASEEASTPGLGAQLRAIWSRCGDSRACLRSAGLPRARIAVTSPLVLLTQRPGCERRGRARVRLWPLPRTLRAGRSDERPSPESSPPAASGGRAEAQRSRPERPALSKSAGGPARDCGPPGSGAPFDRARGLDLHSGRKEESSACQSGQGSPAL